MNIIFVDKPWTRESVLAEPQYIYLFTDNLGRTSGNNPGDMNSWYANYWGGPWFNYPNHSQAVIRGLHNAFPITTMDNDKGVQLMEKDTELITKTWQKEFWMIREASKNYLGIKCCPFQFGNGQFSKLIYYSPKLFNTLSWFLWEYLGIDNRDSYLRLI